MSKDEIIPVIFSMDHNFTMPTGVAIQSLLETSTDCAPHIYILQSDNVTESDREILTSIGNKYSIPVKFISIGNQFNGCFEIRGITIATYFRLLIPWLIPEHDKVLYCDGDIVFNRSVSNIYTFPLGDYYVAGVQTGFKRHTKTGAYIEKLGLNVEQYVNGGVLLINSKKHRELNLKEDYILHAQNKYKFQDQDIINIVCKDHIGLMPRWYNVTPNAVNELIFQANEFQNSQSSGKNQEPVIIHYAGGKPWKEFTYWWAAWWKVYRKSPFFDQTLEFQIERSTLTKIPQISTVLCMKIKHKVPVLKKIRKVFRQIFLK